VASSAATGFGQLSANLPDFGLCVQHASPSCFSASGLRSLRVGTRAVSAPLNLTGNVVGTTVQLTWTATAGASGYILEAGSASGLADLANFATGSALTTFTATNVPSGTYYVRVRAVDSSGAGPASNQIVVVVGGAAGCVAPSAPGNLALTTNAAGTVGLLWNAASGASTYILEAGSAPGLANLALADVGNTTTYTATGVGAGTYYVRVRARSACGTSGASNELTIVVGAAAPSGPIVAALVYGSPWTAATINASLTNGRMTVLGTNPIWSVSFSFFPTGTGTYSIPAAGPSFAFVLSNANPQTGRPVPEWQTSGGPGVGGGGGPSRSSA
jgi:predicted phage tail protein